VDMVINLLVPYYEGNVLHRWETVRFSRTLINEVTRLIPKHTLPAPKDHRVNTAVLKFWNKCSQKCLWDTNEWRMKYGKFIYECYVSNMTDVANIRFLGKYWENEGAGDGIVKKVDDLQEEQLAVMSPDHWRWSLFFWV
jgi:hypothetical protein